jgi:hypothetical protein
MSFESGEDRFGDGVVEAVALRAIERWIPISRQRSSKRTRYCEPWSEWCTSPGFGRRRGDRRLERVDDEFGLEVGSHRPADDPPRVVVHHRR